MFGKRDKGDPDRKRRTKLHETTLENDIRYIGPLTAQHFKILGWLCIAIMQATIIVRLGGRVNADFAVSSAPWLQVLDYISELALPFLLIANFSQLLDPDTSYKRQLLINLAAMAGICALYYVGFYRYIVGGVAAFLKEPSDALPFVQTTIGLVVPYGFFAFNIFVDLLLCTLTMVFLMYKPRRVFTGKSRFLFRLLALLPIGYEVGSMLLKVFSANGSIQIPVWAFPLLTVKPPMTFVLFVILLMFIKTRELRFRRHGKTHEAYKEFLKTRRNSRNFSIFLAVMMILVGIVDFAVAMGFSVNAVMQSMSTNVELSLIEASYSDAQQSPEDLEAALEKAIEAGIDAAEAGEAATEAGINAAEAGETATEAADSAAKGGTATGAAEDVPGSWEALPGARVLTDEEREAAIQAGIDSTMQEEALSTSLASGLGISKAVGFGNSVCLILLAPLMLLFSYTRKPKNRMLDMLIPAAGMTLILIVYLEGIHQLLGILPVGKLDLQSLKDNIQAYINSLL